jgi:putative transposase
VDWAMKRKATIAAAGLCAGRDRSACLSAPSKRPADTELRARMKELASERRRFGYRRLHILLKREGWEGELEEALPALPRRRVNRP